MTDKAVYKDINFYQKIHSDLVAKSNKMSKTFYWGRIPETTANLGKLYVPPKIHKWLYYTPGRPVFSNCGTP